MPDNEASLPELMSQLSDQVTRLARDEIALAKVEVQDSVKHMGIGAGLFGGAGVFGFLGVIVLVAAAVLGLSEALPGWLSALIVAAVLFAVAGIAALVGKKQVATGAPVVPEQAIESVQQDIATIKEARTHE